MQTPRTSLFPADLGTLFIDMDGTLTDLAFDRMFFRETLPARYAAARGLDPEAAAERVSAELAAIQGTLPWYSLAHLGRLFGLDLALLTEEFAHDVVLQEGALDFLARANARYRCVLVTNADPAVLALKLRRTGLADWFDGIISAHHLGASKEEPLFYARLEAIEPDCPHAGLLIDDNLHAIAAARRAGLAAVAISRPDLSQPARQIEDGPVVETIAALIEHL